jgi:hypothetical protein
MYTIARIQLEETLPQKPALGEKPMLTRLKGFPSWDWSIMTLNVLLEKLSVLFG